MPIFQEPYLDNLKREYILKKDNMLEIIIDRYVRLDKEYIEIYLSPYMDMRLIKKYSSICPHGFVFSRNKQLVNSEDFLDNHKHYVTDFYWSAITEILDLDEYMIKKYNHIIDWSKIWKNPSIIPYIDKYEHLIDFEMLSYNTGLTEELLDKYKDKLNWKTVSRMLPLNVYLIEKYKDKIEWGWYLSYNYSIDQDVLEKYSDELGSLRVIFTEYLSVDFIERNFDSLNISKISSCENLTREFIEKYIDRLDMYYLSSNACFTLDLVEKYIHKVNWNRLGRNPNLTLEFINKHIEKLSRTELCYNEFLYNTVVFEKSIMPEIAKRRESIDIDITMDIKEYILKYYVGYDQQ